MKTFLVIMSAFTLINCDSIGYKPDGDSPNYIPNICSIQYHKSDNCDDSVVIKSIPTSDLNEIEDILGEREIGECVFVIFRIISNNGLWVEENGYILNDVQKSWIVNDCREQP